MSDTDTALRTNALLVSSELGPRIDAAPVPDNVTVAQGSLSYWVANHRRHHQYTDRPGDIHSPYYDDERQLGVLEGFWHSHMGWTFGHRMTNSLTFAKDIYREPAIATANRLYYVWVAL